MYHIALKQEEALPWVSCDKHKVIADYVSDFTPLIGTITGH